MKGTIADSITIKVGHGIMTIPVDLEKLKKQMQNNERKESYSEKSKTNNQ